MRSASASGSQSGSAASARIVAPRRYGYESNVRSRPSAERVVDHRPEARRRGRGSARRGCRRRSRAPGRAAPRARPEPGPRSRACGTRAAGRVAPGPRTARRAPSRSADDAGAYSSPVDIPRAPSSRPCSSSRTIAATSSGRAGPVVGPHDRVPQGAVRDQVRGVAPSSRGRRWPAAPRRDPPRNVGCVPLIAAKYRSAYSVGARARRRRCERDAVLAEHRPW